MAIESLFLYHFFPTITSIVIKYILKKKFRSAFKIYQGDNRFLPKFRNFNIKNCQSNLFFFEEFCLLKWILEKPEYCVQEMKTDLSIRGTSSEEFKYLILIEAKMFKIEEIIVDYYFPRGKEIFDSRIKKSLASHIFVVHTFDFRRNNVFTIERT